MANLFYVHWHEAEAYERAAALNTAGHKVQVHWSTIQAPQLKDNLPDIAIISLGRLPSHGRAVAGWLWEAKRRQHIPIIFEDGAREKVATLRSKFPKAHFCRSARVLSVIERLEGRRAARR